MDKRDLPLPPFYDPAHAAEWAYAPDQQALLSAAAGWRRDHGLGDPGRRVELLLIDVQKDFCFPRGSLYVAGRSGTGAMDDNRRIAEFIYRNLGRLSDITVTLDTHLAYQIFFPSFWVDGAGAPLAPHREISAAEIESGQVAPNPAVARWLCGGDVAWLRAQVLHYCRELERTGKYRLYLWPPHCILGSDGHALSGVVHEARMFHAFCRGTQSWTVSKGQDPLSENYSVLRPEVAMTPWGGDRPATAMDTALLDRLLAADALIVAGQAASHCVKSSLDDLLDEVRRRDPARAGRIYVLTDCMSSVTVPDGKGGFLADFTPQAEAAQARYREAGMHLVRSTDPMPGWLHL